MIQLQSFNPLSKANNISFKGNNDYMNVYYTPSDSFDSGENMSFDKHLSINQETNGATGFYTTRGFINGKLVNLHVDYKTKALFFRNYNIEGTLGGEEVNLTADIKGVRGTVGDKQVDLKYHKPLSHNKSGFTGTINDKQINVSTGSPVANAQNENDILILATFLEGADLSEQDGKLFFKNTFPIFDGSLVRDMLDLSN